MKTRVLFLVLGMLLAACCGAVPVKLESEVAENAAVNVANTSALEPPPLYVVRNVQNLYQAGLSHGKQAKERIQAYLFKVWTVPPQPFVQQLLLGSRAEKVGGCMMVIFLTHSL